MTIVAFSGRIASGKSEISRGVAAALTVPRASFGDTVRAVAKDRGLLPDRRSLQDLGDELIGEGWDLFCDRLVEHVDWDHSGLLVVDGVRHEGAIAALTRIAAPATIGLLFIDTPWERRLQWMRERGVSEEQARAADAHGNESEVADVQSRADAVIANVGTLDDAIKASVSAVTRLGLIG